MEHLEIRKLWEVWSGIDCNRWVCLKILFLKTNSKQDGRLFMNFLWIWVGSSEHWVCLRKNYLSNPIAEIIFSKICRQSVLAMGCLLERG